MLVFVPNVKQDISVLRELSLLLFALKGHIPLLKLQCARRVLQASSVLRVLKHRRSVKRVHTLILDLGSAYPVQKGTTVLYSHRPQSCVLEGNIQKLVRAHVLPALRVTTVARVHLIQVHV
jgi:hypothetical protein